MTFCRVKSSSRGAPKASALAVVGDEEEQENGGDCDGKARPVERPASCAGFCADVEPKARAEVAGEIAEAAGHKGHQGLSAGAPGGFDSFVEINLRGDIDQREGEAM